MSALRTSETASGFVPNGETFFHTPNCTGMDGGSNSRKALKKRMLPTPTASMMPCEGTVRIMRKVWLDGDMSLEEASAIAGRDVRKAQGKVKAWPTPNARDWKDTGTKEALQKQVDNGHQMTLGRAAGGALNPTWVEWLMGWPLEWTDLKPLEMDKFQKWLEQHGA
jgi:DNA (cytosine-5)-methyltransferase 1